MNKALRIARRESGIAAFENNCRVTKFQGRYQKAYRVPGTREAGEYAMLVNNTEKLRKKYAAQND